MPKSAFRVYKGTCIYMCPQSLVYKRRLSDISLEKIYGNDVILLFIIL
jgi:hypothetical protein